MNNYEKFNLKLLGRNQEDLKVISAYLQDSIVAIKDIAFLKINRTFIMVVNRFMWEDIEKGVFRENKRKKGSPSMTQNEPLIETLFRSGPTLLAL